MDTENLGEVIQEGGGVGGGGRKGQDSVGRSDLLSAPKPPVPLHTSLIPSPPHSVQINIW